MVIIIIINWRELETNQQNFRGLSLPLYQQVAMMIMTMMIIIIDS